MTNLTADTPGSAAAPAPDQRKIGLLTRLSYGFGSVAYGVKDGGFNYFLLLFYSQVVGIDARLVGLAILLALIVDAVSDPIVGYWSDNLRTSLGRRHPFMYAAAIPVALSYFLLWTPPVGWSEMQIFWYLLVLAILIRTFITFYETPSSALGFELTSDYEQRSTLISFRYFFGWVGGNAMTVMMFMVIFTKMATPEIPNGQFNPEAYHLYGIIAAVLIFVAIVVSAVGTHKHIPNLIVPPVEKGKTLGDVFREIKGAIWERSFMALFVAAIFGAVATGLTSALSFFFYAYFWEFSPLQTGMLTLGVFGSAIIGAFLAPIITRGMGKKRGAVIIGLIAFLGSPLPIVLRLMGILPDNGDPFVFWFVFFAIMIDVGLIICFQILTASMMADLVEHNEVRNGRRAEGVFASATTFIRKLVQGFGVMAATGVLVLANFPKGARPSEVPPEALFRLGLFYVPILLSIWMAMMLAILFYKLDRKGHEDNLAELARRRAAPAKT